MNRDFVIVASQGVCAACGTNYLKRFGELGYRALDVHHLKPLGTQPAGQVTTSTRDLIALCGGCHRLVHSYDDPRAGLEAVTAAWAG